MISRILANTPLWVWGLLLVLLGLGFTQTRTRRPGLRRTLILPLVMTILSIAGVVSSFGAKPQPLLTWAAAAAGAAWLLRRRPVPAHTRYDAGSGRFHIPGSWVPMALILGIFAVKYVAGVLLAIQPSLAAGIGFATTIGTLYGAMSGIFIGRALRLWSLARRPDKALITQGA